MAPVDIYGMYVGGPLRGILSVCKLGDIQYTFHEVDMVNQEHKSEAYMKINPEHTVPAMVDNGFSLWESRAIMIYLAEKYSKDKELYPEDLQLRARINRLLFFDLERVSAKIGPVAYPKMQKKEIEEEKVTAMKDSLTILDKYIEREAKTYLVEDHVTLADCCIWGSLTYLDFADIDYKEFTNITTYLARMKEKHPEIEEIHQTGNESMHGLLEKMMAKAKAEGK